MKKPVDEDEMLLRIKGLLRRAKILTDRRLSVGSTVLDYDSLTVRVGSLPGMFKREQEQLMKKKKMKRLYSVRINLFITGFMFLLLLLTNLISNSLFAFLHRNTLPPERPRKSPLSFSGSKRLLQYCSGVPSDLSFQSLAAFASSYFNPGYPRRIGREF